MFGTASKRNLFASVFAVLTVGAMALFFNVYEPWKPIGPERIADGNFNSPTATHIGSGWNDRARLVPNGGFKKSPGVVLTTCSNQHGRLRFTIHDLKNTPAFRVSLRATASGIKKGKEGYHLPRAVFFYEDADAKSLFSLHHGIMDITKDTGWRLYKDVFPVPEGASNARFQIMNYGVAGIMRIDDLSVIPVRTAPSAPWWNLFFGALWMTSFGFCLFIIRPWEQRYGSLITLMIFLTVAGIVTPGKLLDSSIQKTTRLAKSLPAAIRKSFVPQEPIAIIPDKPLRSASSTTPKRIPEADIVRIEVNQAHMAGHFIFFSLLALFCALSVLRTPLSARNAWNLFALLTFFATATEVLQFIIPDRSPGLGDLFVDTTGMAGAILVVFVGRTLQICMEKAPS